MRAPDHLNALRALETAARHQSFALAAQELNVTPAAVGQLVRRLEESLGVELFHRSQAGPARLVVTEAAQAALPDLRAGFASLAVAMDRLRSARKRRSFTVTVPSAFAVKWLLHRLDTFSRDHPECELHIDTSTALVDLAAQPVDVGICYGAGVWPGLVAFRVREGQHGRAELGLQERALFKAGCEEIYKDHASGAKAERPGLNRGTRTRAPR
jgi:LysR family transcriptional regulator, glycine cleavage system transcriptional activator